MKSTAGITTRSKAKLAPDQWTIMPLPAKVSTNLLFVCVILIPDIAHCPRVA